MGINGWVGGGMERGAGCDPAVELVKRWSRRRAPTRAGGRGTVRDGLWSTEDVQARDDAYQSMKKGGEGRRGENKAAGWRLRKLIQD